MTDWQGYIEVPGGKIYAEADGDGPPVVFVHAGVAHLRMWDEQVAALRDAYRVIRYDTRGYGKTRVDDVPYSNSADLGLVIDHFGVDSAHVVGLSRGAQIALGRNGLVHVAWHGSKPVEGSGSPHPPVWYARSIAGARFEPQQMVSGSISGIDGGTVAADASGRVSVAWHGLGVRPGSDQSAKPGEEDRTVYLANSTNDGTSTTPNSGNCGSRDSRAPTDRARKDRP